MAASPREDALDVLIQKITNPLKDSYDPALVYAFCQNVKQQQDGPMVATRLLAYRVQSPQEKEAMLALDLLETCARTGGAGFRSELGKFRFLNELIKLLSPRYLAHRTPLRVKQRTAQLLVQWSQTMPNQGKIAEAVQLLHSQGLLQTYGPFARAADGTSQWTNDELSNTKPMTMAGIKADLDCPATPLPSFERPGNSIFEDDQKSAQLKQLLQSTAPEDIQAANRLIKTMIKQDEDRAERNSRRLMELETVNTNVRLLEEMMDNYSSETTSQEELDLMGELRTSCEQMRPRLDRLATETDDRENALTDLVSAVERIEAVISRHDRLLLSSAAAPLTLLHLDVSAQQQQQTGAPDVLQRELANLGLSDAPPPPPAAVTSSSGDLLGAPATPPAYTASASGTTSAASGLTDLLGWLSPASASSCTAALPSAATALVTTLSPLPGTLPSAVSALRQPQVAAASPRPATSAAAGATGTRSAFDDLDDLVRLSMSGSGPPASSTSSADSTAACAAKLLSSLSGTASPVCASTGAPPTAQPPIGAAAGATPTGQKQPISEDAPSAANQPLDRRLTDGFSTEEPSQVTTNGGESSLLDLGGPAADQPLSDLLSEDVSMLGQLGGSECSRDSLLLDGSPQRSSGRSGGAGQPVTPVGVISLADICVPLEDIRPGDAAAVPLFTDQSALEVQLHRAGNRPRPDVTVCVITALNRTGRHLTQYTLQAVCDKGARVRLQPPSSQELAAGSPFLPPPAVSQVLLLANPSSIGVTLRLMLSYCDNGETVAEMAEVSHL